LLLVAVPAAAQRILLDKPVRAGGLVAFPDLDDETAYYYVSDKPHLAADAQGRPQFSFLRYVENVRTGAAESEAREGEGGGIVHAVVALSVEPELVRDAQRELRRLKPGARLVGPVAYRAGTFGLVTSFKEENGKLATKVVGMGKAPLLDGEKAAVSMQLTKLGSKILWQSFETPTPDVSFTFEMDIAGYRSPIEATIEANFDQVYEHEMFSAGVATAYLAADIKIAFDDLRRNGAIKVSQVGSDEKLEVAVKAAYDKLIEMMFTKSGGLEPTVLEAAKAGEKSMGERASDRLKDMRKEQEALNEKVRTRNDAIRARNEAKLKAQREAQAGTVTAEAAESKAAAAEAEATKLRAAADAAARRVPELEKSAADADAAAKTAAGAESAATAAASAEKAAATAATAAEKVLADAKAAADKAAKEATAAAGKPDAKAKEEAAKSAAEAVKKAEKDAADAKAKATKASQEAAAAAEAKTKAAPAGDAGAIKKEMETAKADAKAAEEKAKTAEAEAKRLREAATTARTDAKTKAITTASPELEDEVDEYSMPSFNVLATYEMKTVKQSGRFVVDLNKYLTDTIHLRFDENIGDLRALKAQAEHFREVNLADPLYQQREVVAMVDGFNAQDFGQFINFVTVQLKKKHGNGSETTDEVRIDRKNFNSEGNAFKLLYGWDGDNDRRKWLDYEYKATWSFFGGKTVEEPWKKSGAGAVNLAPPYQRREVSLEADPDPIAAAEVRAITAKIFYDLGAGEQSKQTTLNAAKQQLSGKLEFLLPAGSFDYGYEILWRLKGDRTVSSGRKTSSDGVLFVDEVPKS
jgi:hypothetical protein